MSSTADFRAGSTSGGATAAGATSAGASSSTRGSRSHRLETPQSTEPTLGRLVADASRDLSTLVQSEIALAKAEVKVSVTKGGIGAAALVAAGLVAALGVILLSFAVVYFIVMAGLHEAWSFLIVAAFYLLIAALVALFGIRKLKQVRAPERTIETSKKIPPALKGQQQAPAPALPSSARS
ncbi:MAG TPA: phage holin family protein [Nocardioidaceae bacterium]|jgi:amino acid transporter|nr:phage holin family protein [Nocardioidaceae bacterium]